MRQRQHNPHVQIPDFAPSVPLFYLKSPWLLLLEPTFSECECFKEPVPDLLGADTIDQGVEGRCQQQIDVRQKDVHRLWDSVMPKAVCEVGEEIRHILRQE
jgi:hypothetical protein